MVDVKPIRLFYSYSHKDEKFREELETHLAILRRRQIIREWHDRKIDPGDKWRSAIDEQLSLADVILLLVTPDFMASDFCYDKELAQALERHRRGEVVVIPVIVRPVDFEDSPFAELQALPTDAKPVTIWENRDEAWLSVSRGIRKVCRTASELKGQPKNADAKVVNLPEHDSEYGSLDEADFGVVDFNAILEERFADLTATQEHVATRTQEVVEFFTAGTKALQGFQTYSGRDKARQIQKLASPWGNACPHLQKR